MQGLVLQLSRGLLLVLLWLFIYLALRALKTDVFGNVGMRSAGRGERKGGFLGRGSKAIRYLVVTQGALSGTRITLTEQPVLLGRADSCTLVLDDDSASNQHAPHTALTGSWKTSARQTAPIWTDRGSPPR